MPKLVLKSAQEYAAGRSAPTAMSPSDGRMGEYAPLRTHSATPANTNKPNAKRAPAKMPATVRLRAQSSKTGPAVFTAMYVAATSTGGIHHTLAATARRIVVRSSGDRATTSQAISV